MRQWEGEKGELVSGTCLLAVRRRGVARKRQGGVAFIGETLGKVTVAHDDQRDDGGSREEGEGAWYGARRVGEGEVAQADERP